MDIKVQSRKIVHTGHRVCCGVIREGICGVFSDGGSFSMAVSGGGD